MQAKNNLNNKLNQILIIFETTSYSPYSLESVIKLAASLNAAIHGIYIEDQDLLNAVELPFVREIAYHTANVRHTDRRLMMQQLRNYSEKIKHSLQTQAGSFSVTATFSSVRGRRLSEIEQQINVAKIILLPARKSLSGSEQDIKRPSARKHIAVVYDKSPSSENCLTTAISIARITGIELLVLTNTSDIDSVLKQQSIKYVLIKIDANQCELVFPVLKKYAPKLLVVPATSQLLQQEHYLQRHINQFNYDVMIVR